VFTVKIPIVLLFTFHERNCIFIPVMLTFYADEVLVMGDSGNSRFIFNFAILLKSQIVDAREIFTFYSTAPTS